MRFHLHVFNKAETGWPLKTAQWSLGLTVRGRYFGHLAKGWWRLGRWSGMESLEVEFALGGEDNMAQVGGAVPLLGRGYVGVRVPRWLTRGWIYQRREWKLRVGYVGSWLEVLIGFDSSARDMHSYYRRKREQGEDLIWSRLATWPGIRLSLRPRLRDRLFGRPRCETTEGPWESVEIPMPEGNYAGRVRKETRVWKRPRWPWIRQRRVEWWVDMIEGVPHAGKGENSYDCGDDAVMGTGGSTRAEAIANVTRAALRNRERYGEASTRSAALTPPPDIQRERGRMTPDETPPEDARVDEALLKYSPPLMYSPPLIAVCTQPCGGHIHWPIDEPADAFRCIMECDCKPLVYRREPAQPAETPIQGEEPIEQEGTG